MVRLCITKRILAEKLKKRTFHTRIQIVIWFALIFQTNGKFLHVFETYLCQIQSLSLAIAVARKQLQCDFSLRIFNENINQFFLTSSNCFYLLLLLFCWFLIACRWRQSFRRSAYTHTFGKNSYDSYEECDYHTFFFSPTHTHDLTPAHKFSSMSYWFGAPTIIWKATPK